MLALLLALLLLQIAMVGGGGWGWGGDFESADKQCRAEGGVASQNPLEPMMILSRVKHLVSRTTVRLPMHFTDVCFLSLNVGKWAVGWSTVDTVETVQLDQRVNLCSNAR